MKWYRILRFANCTRMSLSSRSVLLFKSITDIVIPWGKALRNCLSPQGKKCFIWHSATPCDQDASIVGCMHFSTCSISSNCVPLIWTVREVTSTLSEIRWQLLGRRKSMSETSGRPCSLPTVFCFSTTSLGKTYCKTVHGNFHVIWQQAALGSTWQAIRYFSCLLWELVIPRFCKKPTCCILSCSKLYNHAEASNSHASLRTVKTKWTEMSRCKLMSTNFWRTNALGNERQSPTPVLLWSNASS